MKNDLSKIEKDLIRSINQTTGKKYTHKNFQEWSSSESVVKGNLQDGEVMYEALGLFVAMKEM